jgi:hypothetical protein
MHRQECLCYTLRVLVHMQHRQECLCHTLRVLCTPEALGQIAGGCARMRTTTGCDARQSPAPEVPHLGRGACHRNRRNPVGVSAAIRGYASA